MKDIYLLFGNRIVLVYLGCLKFWKLKFMEGIRLKTL